MTTLKGIYAAARNNNHSAVKQLVISSQLSDEERYDWFSQALIDGEENVAQVILQNGLLPQERRDGINAERSKAVVIKMLIERISQNDELPRAVFMNFAINEGKEDLVSLILSKGFNIHEKIIGPFTAIQRAVMLGHPKIVETLLIKKANVNSRYKGSTLLHAAVYRCCEETVSLLLKHGATVDAERKRDGTTALYTAVEKGFLQIATKLIDSGANFKAKFSTNSLDPLKKTIYCHQDIIFIQSKLRPSQLTTGRYPREDGKNWTLLHLAAETGHVNIAKLLLEKGAEVNAYDNFCRTPLYWAALNRHEEVVRLLHRHGADIDPTDFDNHTPLHCFAIGGYVESARIVLKFGADFDAENVLGLTPLYFATEYRHLKIRAMLLAGGANPKIYLRKQPSQRFGSEDEDEDRLSETVLPFLRAVFERSVEFKGLPEKDNQLLKAVFSRFEPRVRLLLEQGANVNTIAENRHGMSALLIAADRGDLKIVRTLLEFGADTNFKDSALHQNSALHIAAEKGFYQVVKVLLLHGADPELGNKGGATALLLAVLKGAFGRQKSEPSCLGVPADYSKTIKVLLKFGADINAVDYHKRTPLNLAAFRLEQPLPLEVILEHGNADMDVVPEVVANQLFDEINTGFQCRRSSIFRWEDEGTTEEVLVLHFIKMKAANIYQSEGNYVAREFNDPEVIGAFRLACTAEVLLMQLAMIGDTAISFYDILAKPLSALVAILSDPSQRETIVGTLNTNDYRSVFPIY